MHALTFFLALWSAAAPARAWHGNADYAKRAVDGGGDGMYFSGSSRSRRFDCGLCHVESAGAIRLAVDVEPAALLTEARWEPGVTYRMAVTLVGEHRGLGSSLNPNTFVMEIVGADGEQAGLFSALGGNVDRPPGEELVVARGELANGATAWTFDWTAPAAGSGALRLHLAGVDGDGAGDRLGRTGDPFGDDVFVAALDLTESGITAPQAEMTGCSTTGASSGATVLLATILLLIAVPRRRRNSLPGPFARCLLPVACCLLPVSPLLLSAACHDPAASYDDCPRAICGLEPPPGEDAGRRRPPPGSDAGPEPGADGSIPVPPGEDAGPGGEVDAGVPPVGCTPRWVCTTFATACDGSSEATRSCTDEAGCGSDWARPPLTATLPALDQNFYRCRVQPVFDRLCAQAACHGAEERPLRVYARGKWRMNERWRGNHEDGSPALTDEEWCRNYDSARSFDTGAGAASELVTQPLDPLLGGLPHAGFTLFYDTADAEYGALRDWLDGASLGSCDTGFN